MLKLIRISEPGFENYTGPLGEVQFVDGLAEVTPMQLGRIGAAMRVVDAETESQVGPAVDLENSLSMRAAVEEPLARGEGNTPVETELSKTEPTVVLPTYTREALEELADKKGINGLREVGDQFGVKSNSIPGLIEKIVQAQEIAKAKAAQ